MVGWRVKLAERSILAMALVSTGFVGRISLLDEEGSRSTLEYVLTAADFATALADMQAIVGHLAAITDAAIGQWTVGEVYAENALTLPDGIENEKRALITAKVSGTFPQEYVNLFVPAPSGGIFLAETGPDARIVDPNDADLQAYLTHFATGGEATVSDGQVIVTPSSPGAFYGKKVHRGSRSG